MFCKSIAVIFWTKVQTGVIYRVLVILSLANIMHIRMILHKSTAKHVFFCGWDGLLIPQLWALQLFDNVKHLEISAENSVTWNGFLVDCRFYFLHGLPAAGLVSWSNKTPVQTKKITEISPNQSLFPSHRLDQIKKISGYSRNARLNNWAVYLAFK